MSQSFNNPLFILDVSVMGACVTIFVSHTQNTGR